MTGYTPTLFALPFAVAALIVFAVGIAILLRERFSRVGWLHFFLSSSVGGWQTSTALEVMSASPGVAIGWSRLALLFALFIIPIQYQFCCVITGQLHARRRSVAAAWTMTALLVASLGAGFTHARLVHYSWGYYPIFAPAGWAFVFFTVVVVSLCIGMYWRLYRGNRPGGVTSRRGLLLLSGLLMGAIGIVDFLPTLGLAIFPFGGLAVTLGNLINAYTTWKYRLFEITPAYAADQLMDSMSDGVVLIDRDGVVRLVNPSACEILGIDRASLLSRLPPVEFAEVVLGWQHVPFFPANDASLGEREYVTPDGTHRMLDVNVALLREPGLEPGVAVITLRDITAAVRAQEQIERLAYYDSLTHLPNRLLLRERFDEALARARRARALCATLFMDLDRFKQVNDTLGHDAGDVLLKGVAERITACVRETDWVLRNADEVGGSTLARLGGDEFVLLLAPMERLEDAATVAGRILEALSRPFTLKRGAEVITGASIGISIYPHDGDDAETLMKKADLAMYQAKESGRNIFRFYDEEMNAAALAHTDLESGLRRGLARNELLLQYQPQVALRDGNIAGLDAQLYWRHPEKGVLPAAEFISASEDASVAVPLAQWLIRSACIQLRAWCAAGLNPLYLCISLPPGVAERGDLPRIVREALAHAGVDPGLLMINVRGTGTQRIASRTHESLEALQAMGVRLVLDDFGSGQASFASLSQYPLAMVRFESDFFRRAAGSADTAEVTRAMISMVHTLDLGVIVTGVESETQAAFLRDAGCDLVQGVAFGPAVSAEEVPLLLSHIQQQLEAV